MLYSGFTKLIYKQIYMKFTEKWLQICGEIIGSLYISTDWKNNLPIFEKSRGYNIHSDANPWDGVASTCQGDATLGLETNYDGANNVVHYEVGKSYRLAWPGNSITTKSDQNHWFVLIAKTEVRVSQGFVLLCIVYPRSFSKMGKLLLFSI